MEIFGMKDLLLTHVDRDRKQEGSSRLLAFADSMLRVDGQIAGSEVQSGSISVGLISLDLFSRYQTWIKDLSKTLNMENMLICIPPKGKVNDQKAMSILANQLTLP